MGFCYIPLSEAQARLPNLLFKGENNELLRVQWDRSDLKPHSPCAMVVGTILALGSLFIFLAANRLLPSKINAFSRLKIGSQLLGAAVAISGVALALLGVVRYKRSQKALNAFKFHYRLDKTIDYLKKNLKLNRSGDTATVLFLNDESCKPVFYTFYPTASPSGKFDVIAEEGLGCSAQEISKFAKDILGKKGITNINCMNLDEYSAAVNDFPPLAEGQ